MDVCYTESYGFIIHVQQFASRFFVLNGYSSLALFVKLPRWLKIYLEQLLISDDRMLIPIQFAM